MQTTTKFNMGDKVFALNKKLTRIVEFEVAAICVLTTKYGTTITYHHDDDDTCYEESRCFASREELINSLCYGD